MTERKAIESWLTDMDGVLVHEGEPVPGAPEFVNRMKASGKPFLILTNNSIYTPRDLQARLNRMGFDVPEQSIWTAALATAQFLADQRPGGTAYVIGEAGLTTAMHAAGYVLTEFDPDYVVLGETRTYSFEAITKAIRLIDGGARFICTNPDATGPSNEGALPAGRLGGRDDLQGDRRRPVLRRQAQPDDDALGAEHHRGAQREHRDDRRPDGHRRALRPGGRAGDDPGADRHQHPRGERALPVPPVPHRQLGRRPDRRDLTAGTADRAAQRRPMGRMRNGVGFGRLPGMNGDPIPSAEAAAGLLLGGRYRLDRPVGAGGMAVVWAAHDDVLARTVAVKVLAASDADDPRSRDRIRQEARAAAALSHPNIAQVHDYGETVTPATAWSRTW